MPVVEADRRQDLRDLVKFYTLPVNIADKEQLRARMVDDMDGIVGTEILQNRNDDRAIGDRSQIDRYPITVVLSHHGDLVVLLDAAFLEQDMQLLDVDRQLTVRERDVRPIVRHCRTLPVIAKRPFIDLHKIVFFFQHHKAITF